MPLELSYHESNHSTRLFPVFLPFEKNLEGTSKPLILLMGLEGEKGADANQENTQF